MTTGRGSFSVFLNNKIRHINFFLLLTVLSLMHGNLFFFNILYIKDVRIKEYHSLSLTNASFNIINERSKRSVSTNIDINNDKAYPIPQDIINAPEDKHTISDKKLNYSDKSSTPRRIILTRSTIKDATTIPTTTKESEWIDAEEYIKNTSIVNIDPLEEEMIEENEISHFDGAFSYKLPDNLYKSLLETLLFSSPGIGMIIGLFPITKCVHKYGIQRMLTICGLVNGCCTAFVPIVIDMNSIYLLIIIRFVVGFFTSATFSIIGSHIVNWESIGDQTSSLNIGIVSSILGSIITWPLVSFCTSPTSIGYVHYLLSSVLVTITGIFYTFYRNDPTRHPWIRGPELIKIRSCKVISQKVDKAKVFSQIIMCLDTWILVISSMAYFALISFGLTYLPFFTYYTLQYSFTRTIITSILPLIFLFVSHGLMSIISYFINNRNSLNQSRIYNSLAYFTSASFLSAIIFLTPDMGIKNLTYLLIAFSFIPLGFVCFGFLQCTTSVGKHYGQYIVGMYQISFSVSLTFIPFLVNFTVKNNDIYEWKFFILHLSILFLICNVVYIFLAEIEPLRFAEDSWLDDTKYQNNQEMRLIGLDEDYGIVEMNEIKG
uniref:MFS domain-containing protein n=1 Tax=Strongyloides papillosus TaxID=174720 RepID=A0A0N5BBH0_STREA